MPHVSVQMPEEKIVGREGRLIAALTDAVAGVYGRWARDLVVVHLEGVTPGRWGVGGRVVDDPAPAVTFGIREAALRREDGEQIADRLVASLTDALADVVGEDVRGGIGVELVATPAGRTGLGGQIVDR